MPVVEVTRVVRAPGPARPVLADMAAALRPVVRAQPEPRRGFMGWWPWARA
jgi:hypothetical protein